MGTRINVMFENRLDDYRDKEEVLKRLAQALPEALAVQKYWDGIATRPEKTWPSDERWVEAPIGTIKTVYAYDGPGTIFLKVSSRLVRIRTGGRWRGFLSIPDLRDVHLKAFRSIAAAFGATTVVYFHDVDDLFDLFYVDENTNLDAYIEKLMEIDGPPQLSIDAIDPEITAATETGVPCVWYLESAHG